MGDEDEGRQEKGLRVVPGGTRPVVGERLFEELALPLLDDLYRVACRFERDRERAQDLLQEALLTGFRKCRQLKTPTSFRPWMIAVIRSTYLNQRHRRSGEPISFDEVGTTQVAAEPFEPERRLLARRLSLELEAALDRLPEGQRLAVFLIDVQDYSYAAASEALGVAPGTVASRVARGRATLRGFLTQVARERGWAEP